MLGIEATGKRKSRTRGPQEALPASYGIPTILMQYVH